MEDRSPGIHCYHGGGDDAEYHYGHVKPCQTDPSNIPLKLAGPRAPNQKIGCFVLQVDTNRDLCCQHSWYISNTVPCVT
jgi:hypothetical protein